MRHTRLTHSLPLKSKPRGGSRAICVFPIFLPRNIFRPCAALLRALGGERPLRAAAVLFWWIVPAVIRVGAHGGCAALRAAAVLFAWLATAAMRGLRLVLAPSHGRLGEGVFLLLRKFIDLYLLRLSISPDGGE